MTPQEAQNLSPHGVAIWGNTAMKDIVWPKDYPHPFWWIVNGYAPLPLTHRCVISDEWEPLTEKDWTLRLRNA